MCSQWTSRDSIEKLCGSCYSLPSIEPTCGRNRSTGVLIGRKYGHSGDRPPPLLDVATASRGFIIENDTANTALEASKVQHARR